MIEQSRYNGVYEDKKRRRLYTISFVPGSTVYNEPLITIQGTEYREWNITKSKIAAGIAKGIRGINFTEGDAVLYLGVASGTTASHISDIIGKRGILFGIDISPVSLRNLVFVAEQRRNIAPLLADAAHPDTYKHRICQCDVIVQDIAQHNQLELFFNNLHFLKPGGIGMISIKSRSIDITQPPHKIYHLIQSSLEKHLNLIDWKTLDPFEKDHALFIVQKK